MIHIAQMTNRDRLQFWFDEVWTKGNYDAIEQMFKPDAEANGLFPAFGLSTADYRDLALAIRHLISDLQVIFSHALEQDDWLAVRTVIKAKRADTLEHIEVTGQVFVRFEEHQIAEIYSHLDFFSLFEKLGQLPRDALAICLTGEGLQWA